MNFHLKKNISKIALNWWEFCERIVQENLPKTCPKIENCVQVSKLFFWQIFATWPTRKSSVTHRKDYLWKICEKSPDFKEKKFWNRHV
jgi:hypothetical protein